MQLAAGGFFMAENQPRTLYSRSHRRHSRSERLNRGESDQYWSILANSAFSSHSSGRETNSTTFSSSR